MLHIIQAIMKYLFVMVCLILLLAPSIFAQGDIDSDMDVFSQSIATGDDISVGFFNPANLANGPMMALRYMHATTDSTIKGDDGFMLATRGTLLSVQWLNHTNGVFRRKFLFAGSKLLFPNFYWGLSIAYFNGNEMYKDKQIWKLGTLYTPMPFVNLAAVVDDINQPKFDGYQVKRLYVVGIGIKANNLKLRVSADAWMRENEQLEDVRAKLRMEFTIDSKLRLAAQYLTDGRFQIGVGYNIQHISLGIAGNYIDDAYRGGNFYYNQLPIGAR